MMRPIPSLVLAAGLWSLSAGVATAGYMSLYAFGDSLSDSGNMYNAVWALTGGTVQVPPPPYYQGRASNGPVAVEYMAAHLGLTAKPVITQDGGIDSEGTNFAVLGSATGPVKQVGGAEYGNYMTFRYDTSLPNVGIDFQVWSFADLTDGVPDGSIGGVADPRALYFYWGGANDAYLALEDPGIDQNNDTQMKSLAKTTALQAAGNVKNQLLFLASLGATDFLVPNLPDLGKTPDALFGSYGSAYASALTLYTQTFNDALADLIITLDADPHLRVIGFDVASVFETYRASGLYEVLQPCILDPACEPERYMFWDGVHPTTYFHAELGRLMAQAVPEPATLTLLLPGLLALGWMAQRHSGP